eukprot:2069969-Pleurochrysis_carterae.AAC.2
MQNAYQHTAVMDKLLYAGEIGFTGGKQIQQMLQRPYQNVSTILCREWRQSTVLTSDRHWLLQFMDHLMHGSGTDYIVNACRRAGHAYYTWACNPIDHMPSMPDIKDLQFAKNKAVVPSSRLKRRLTAIKRTPETFKGSATRSDTYALHRFHFRSGGKTK